MIHPDELCISKCDQAGKYIALVESIPTVERNIVLFAKLSMASKLGDLGDCASNADEIISTVDSYAIAVNTFTIFCENCIDRRLREQLFETLLVAFSK